VDGIWAVLAARQPPARSIRAAARRSRVGGVTARLMAPTLLPSPPIRGVTDTEGSQTMTQETKAITFAPKFQLGQIVATPGAIAACRPERLTICLHRHSRGDWGNVCAEDKALNDLALVEGERVLSAYAIDESKPAKGYGENCLWIITERDRSVTTFLLPNEN
jgi:hypothetical protein